MWRRERLHKIKRAVTRMLTLFPFEPPYYERASIDVAFVGHPLTDITCAVAARRPLHASVCDCPLGAPVFALLPGSRQSELRHMAELFVETAKRIHARIPEAYFLVPLATRETRTLFEIAIVP
jgi:lipid-A-disaccharide synthase